jgi:large subunit ribosomal protein L10
VNRTQKQENITALQSDLADAKSVVVLHYRGLTVAEVTALRKKARENGVTIKVAKNRLAKRAIDGSKFGALANILKGPTAIAYSKDEVAAAKAVVDFAKNNEKVAIIGGALNENALDEAGIKSLAALPSLDQSRAMLIALINTPATRIAGILQAPGGQVARVISAKASKGE